MGSRFTRPLDSNETWDQNFEWMTSTGFEPCPVLFQASPSPSTLCWSSCAWRQDGIEGFPCRRKSLHMRGTWTSILNKTSLDLSLILHLVFVKMEESRVGQFSLKVFAVVISKQVRWKMGKIIYDRQKLLKNITWGENCWTLLTWVLVHQSPISIWPLCCTCVHGHLLNGTLFTVLRIIAFFHP